MQLPSSVLAFSLKLNASESVHPGKISIQLPSSVLAFSLKLNASESIHPGKTSIHNGYIHPDSNIFSLSLVQSAPPYIQIPFSL